MIVLIAQLVRKHLNCAGGLRPVKLEVKLKISSDIMEFGQGGGDLGLGGRPGAGSQEKCNKSKSKWFLLISNSLFKH